MGKRINPALIAANSHAFMCNCDAGYGYDWDNRFGQAQYGTDYVDYKGHTSTFYRGQRDCSSSVIDCWQEALIGTQYEGCLAGATYTGNIESVFVGSGLFVAKPMSFLAEPGDLYLNTVNHVAMCQSQIPDMLSEFCIGETGGVYGNAPGDQTGYEAYIHGYYDYPWNKIIHYIGGELEYNFDGGNDYEPTYNQPSQPAPQSNELPRPRYRVYTKEHGWLGWMKDLAEEDGGSDDYAGVPGCWIYDMEFDLPSGSWFELTLKDGTVLGRNQYNSAHNQPIMGVTVYYNTPNPGSTGYYCASYRVHPVGGDWLKWETDDEDGGAGDDRNPIDMFQLTLEKD